MKFSWYCNPKYIIWTRPNKKIYFWMDTFNWNPTSRWHFTCLKPKLNPGGEHICLPLALQVVCPGEVKICPLKLWFGARSSAVLKTDWRLDIHIYCLSATLAYSLPYCFLGLNIKVYWEKWKFECLWSKIEQTKGKKRGGGKIYLCH